MSRGWQLEGVQVVESSRRAVVMRLTLRRVALAVDWELLSSTMRREDMQWRDQLTRWARSQGTFINP